MHGEKVEASFDRKYGGLEICRFLCALAVIIYHYPIISQIGLWNEAVRPAYSVLPFARVLHFFYTDGHLAVPIFWIISGFIFFWKYADKISNRKIATYEFFVLRFSRLYPLHFATLLLVALLQFLYVREHGDALGFGNNDVRHFIIQLFMASNWFKGQPYSFNFPIWSVSVEILAYAAFFALLRFVKPSVVMIALAALTMKVAAHFFYQPLVSCLLYFFVGGLIQLVNKLIDRQHRYALLAISGGLCAFMLMAQMTHWQVTFAVAIVVFFISLGECFDLQIVDRLRIGDVTYSSYLLHFPIMIFFALISNRLGFAPDVFFNGLVFIGYLVVTFAVAFAAYSLFEVEAQRALRSKLLSSHSRVRKAATIADAKPTFRLRMVTKKQG